MLNVIFFLILNTSGFLSMFDAADSSNDYIPAGKKLLFSNI